MVGVWEIVTTVVGVMVEVMVSVGGTEVKVCVARGVRVVSGAGIAHEQNVETTAPAIFEMLDHCAARWSTAVVAARFAGAPLVKVVKTVEVEYI
jgi:hypothetical protein